MQLNLIPHPERLPSKPFQLWATVDYAGAFGSTATTNIRFGIVAPADLFVIPAPSEQERVDGLWQTTCFEAFFGDADGESYREWNFAPSTEWAAYDFMAYRQGMQRADVAKPPYIRVEDNLTWWSFGATVSVDANERWKLGLSAVLEEKDGTKSYWSLAHCGDDPDFHDPDCFVARLP